MDNIANAFYEEAQEYNRIRMAEMFNGRIGKNIIAFPVSQERKKELKRKAEKFQKAYEQRRKENEHLLDEL